MFPILVLSGVSYTPWLYLRGTTSTCLEFCRCKDSVVGYVDSDFASDLNRRRSLLSYVFSIGGCAVSWKASLQPIVALSTTEAEYIAMTEGVKKAMWLRGLFEELTSCWDLTIVYSDSQSAIHLSKDQMFHERTKHIDVKFHFVRDVIGKRPVIVKKISTKDNPTDILTKSLTIIKFKHCLDLVAVSSI
uniref:Retrovirus-related Pol polyprotein from transposon TNT 1-94 n=1 Tax=Ananas comosus var. bracteatus TaxID=296719 RepID=A0A6V7P1U6_ANACO|nr:unnamed protein product [Ananas comosus var. bracteatus]